MENIPINPKAQGAAIDRSVAPLMRGNKLMVLMALQTIAVVVLGAAIYQMLPLKTVEPYIMRVDATALDVQRYKNELEQAARFDPKSLVFLDAQEDLKNSLRLINELKGVYGSVENAKAIMEMEMRNYSLTRHKSFDEYLLAERMRNARLSPWVLVAALLLLLLSVEFLVKDASAVSAVIAPAAQAATASGSEQAGAAITSVNSMLSSIGTFIAASMATANAKAALLIPDGQSLLIAIAGMMLAWNAVLWILGGSMEDIIKSFITFVLVWGLAKYALDNYATLTNTIAAGFDYIAAKLGVDPRNFMQTLFQSAFAPMDAVGKVFKDMSGWEFASNFFTLMIMGLLAGIISIVIFIVGAVVMAIISISQVLFAIAVVLGPVLIPFMLLPVLSGLATGWLNYLIYTGFVKVVGVVMIVFISGFTQSSVSATPNNINTETLSLSELLDYRYSLPADERNAVKANRVIAGDPKKMFMWSFHCIYQDRPVLVILAGTVLLYHVFKLGVAAVSAVL